MSIKDLFEMRHPDEPVGGPLPSLTPRQMQEAVMQQNTYSGTSTELMAAKNAPPPWAEAASISDDEKHMKVLLFIAGRRDTGAFSFLNMSNGYKVVAYRGGKDLVSFSLGKKITPDVAGKFMAWAGLLPNGS